MAMTEPKFAPPQLSGAADDDIPQTFRRERDAREKEAREREAREAKDREARVARDRDTQSTQQAAKIAQAAKMFPAATDAADRGYTLPDIRPMQDGVKVTALNVPFFRLTAFFIKAVFAAIPALLILIAILWTIGQIAQTYFPWLIKMRILIQFP
jgi:hypothetical protein